jgi:cold shock CspA family protein
MTEPFESGRGVVAGFDEPRGLGTIEDEAGAEVPFHCTAILDGSRTIPEGQHVRFVVTPGDLGRWEAARIEPA